MTRRIASVLVLLLASGPASADPAKRVDVEVGATLELDVGTLRGLICDDVQIITPELRTHDDKNWLSITGVSVGETLCRVGTEPGRVAALFDVHVVAASAKKPAPKR